MTPRTVIRGGAVFGTLALAGAAAQQLSYAKSQQDQASATFNATPPPSTQLQTNANLQLSNAANASERGQLLALDATAAAFYTWYVWGKV